jgi:hypothetical protein
MKTGLCLEGLSQITIRTYVADVIKTGTCYWKLNHLVSMTSKINEQNGFVYNVSFVSFREHYSIDFFIVGDLR